MSSDESTRDSFRARLRRQSARTGKPFWLPPLRLVPGPGHPVPLPCEEHDERRVWIPVDGAALNQRMSTESSYSETTTTQVLTGLLSQVVRYRPAVTEFHVERVAEVAIRFPNFAPFIDWLVQSLRMSAASGMPVMIRPHLLLGEPGLGKSFIVRHIAEALGMHYDRLNMPDVTANFELTGGTGSWNSAQPGFIARSLARGPVPWLIFDELDKCALGDERFPVKPALLSMLETSTAREFRDENLQLHMDIRPLVFSFTANDIDGIDAPLRSRLQIFKIQRPGQLEMPALVASVDSALREDDPRIDALFPPITPDIEENFPPMTARAVQQILLDCYGRMLDEVSAEPRVAISPRVLLEVMHQHRTQATGQRQIGFHA